MSWRTWHLFAAANAHGHCTQCAACLPISARYRRGSHIMRACLCTSTQTRRWLLAQTTDNNIAPSGTVAPETMLLALKNLPFHHCRKGQTHYAHMLAHFHSDEDVSKCDAAGLLTPNSVHATDDLAPFYAAVGADALCACAGALPLRRGDDAHAGPHAGADRRKKRQGAPYSVFKPNHVCLAKAG